MAGIEPASERFDPRIYYERIWFISVTLWRESQQNRQRPAARARKPSFVRFTAVRTALWLCDAHSAIGQRAMQVNVASLRRPAVSLRLKRRGAWQRRKCDWHL